MRPIQGVKVPEPMGLVTGTVYLLLMFTFIPFAFVHQVLHPSSLPCHISRLTFPRPRRNLNRQC